MCQLDISCNVSYESLAQLVEHLTFNQGVQGSNPCRVTILFMTWNNSAINKNCSI